MGDHAPWTHWNKAPLVTVEEFSPSNAALRKWQKKISKARRLSRYSSTACRMLPPLWTPGIREESLELAVKSPMNPSPGELALAISDEILEPTKETPMNAEHEKLAPLVLEESSKPVPKASMTADPYVMASVAPEEGPKPDQKPSMDLETKGLGRCPVAKEFQKVQDHHSILASTGCTRQFCQAGRAVHTDEPRIGENRAVNVVKQEAEAFLRDYYRENHFDDEKELLCRLQQVLEEIEGGACDGVVRETKKPGKIGGNWDQTSAELEFGIRRAWRNSRKCIMRSHCEELR
ncbi:MAG: hypothetical protein Q9191_007199 [Dirinaria sp. TL-2023a]